ncbi:dihydrodipicolinate synthase family protein, partial [Rhizobium sp. SEMIA 4085]|uniref:dihydrodipicolinate synthase family protein n=1 Tax=Rhizobium sp. SEMIA 4085 TaxID=2137761 RepID=UPI001FEDB16B
MFKGSIPALVTPFTDAGLVDEASFASHVDWQIREGSSGLVPVGTTGESPTLSHGEHKRVVEICIEAAARRVPVMAGARRGKTRAASTPGPSVGRARAPPRRPRWGPSHNTAPTGGGAPLAPSAAARAAPPDDPTSRVPHGGGHAARHVRQRP